LEKDRPIDDANKDLLGREVFANELATAIIKYVRDNDEGLVIGLEGPWGSGKTSLINLMKAHLHDKLSINSLNSWLSVDKESLIMEFFKTMSENVASGEKTSNIIQNLKKYAQNFIKATSINCQFVQINLGKLMDSPEKDTIQKQKNSLQEKLKELDGLGIVYFIDDIDRLSDEKISTVFQLVKNIADFPKVIYVLAYDRDVVEKALDNVQRGKGETYLQKVVQVPFEIPEPSHDDVCNYFYQKLNTIIDEKWVSLIDRDHFSLIFRTISKGYFQNIRDCNRILNVLRLKYANCGIDCDLGDLLGIIILEIYEPQVLQLIRSNKLAMCGQGLLGILSLKENDAVDIANRILKMIPDTKQATVKELLKIMFPKFSEIANWGQGYTTIVHSPIATNKIQVSTYFDRYFMLVLSKTEVSTQEIWQLLPYDDAKYITSRLAEWNTESKLKYVFEKAGALLEEHNGNPNDINIDFRNIVVWLHALSNVSLIELHETFGGNVYIIRFIRVLLTFIPKNDLEHDLYKIFADNYMSLGILFDLLKIFSVGNKWCYSTEDSLQVNSEISQRIFDSLQGKFLDRVEQNANDNGFLDGELIAKILYIWKCHRKATFSKYVREINNDVILGKLITVYMLRITYGRDTKTSCWQIDSTWPDELNREQCYSKMKKLVHMEQFMDLNEIQKYGICSFIKCIEKSKNEGKSNVRVERQEVDEMLNDL
jgi:hypothetical protein